MALVFSTRGKCLEATFSGHITAAEVFNLWNQLAGGIKCGLVILRDLTQIPPATELQSGSSQAPHAPLTHLAFVGTGITAYGFARILAMLCGVPNAYNVFTREEMRSNGWTGPDVTHDCARQPHRTPQVIAPSQRAAHPPIGALRRHVTCSPANFPLHTTRATTACAPDHLRPASCPGNYALRAACISGHALQNPVGHIPFFITHPSMYPVPQSHSSNAYRRPNVR